MINKILLWFSYERCQFCKKRRACFPWGNNKPTCGGCADKKVLELYQNIFPNDWQARMEEAIRKNREKR